MKHLHTATARLAQHTAPLVAAIGLLGAAAGCAADASVEDDSNSDDIVIPDALAGTCSGALYYGSCEFLHDASRYSRSLPAGRILPYCTPTDSGIDCSALNEGVVAVPRNTFSGRSMCGRYVKVQYQGKSTYAKIVERSNTDTKWELSSKVFDDLGASYKDGSYSYTTRTTKYGSGCLAGAAITVMPVGFNP